MRKSTRSFSLTVIAIVVATLCAREAHAWDSHIQNEISYRFTDRIYYNDTYPTVFETYDNYVDELLDMSLTHGGLTLDVRPELRYIKSDALDLAETEISHTIYRNDHRLMNLGYEFAHSYNDVTMSDVDRLYVNYAGSNWQATIGRSPFGIGNMRVLTIWNRFTPSLLNTGTTDLVFNPDLAMLSGQWGPFSLGAIEIAAQHPEDQIHLVHSVFYGEWIELQALGGSWWERPVGGLGFSKDLGGAQLRGESLFIGSSKTENSEIQAAAGIEDAVTSKITLLAEYLYQEAGGRNHVDYISLPASRFRPLLAIAYVYAQIGINVTDFSHGEFGTLVNLADGSTLANLSLSYSLSDHFDIGGEARIPLGNQDQEFGHVQVSDTPPVALGYPQRYSFHVKAVF